MYRCATTPAGTPRPTPRGSSRTRFSARGSRTKSPQSHFRSRRWGAGHRRFSGRRSTRQACGRTRRFSTPESERRTTPDSDGTNENFISSHADGSELKCMANSTWLVLPPAPFDLYSLTVADSASPRKSGKSAATAILAPQSRSESRSAANAAPQCAKAQKTANAEIIFGHKTLFLNIFYSETISKKVGAPFANAPLSMSSLRAPPENSADTLPRRSPLSASA